MCLFTLEVDRVSDTRIFARSLGERQILVYEMKYAAKSDLAMVLPIPVPPGTPEDAVRFVNLEDCTDFFRDLDRAFPSREEVQLGAAVDMLSLDIDAPVKILEVHDVGAFEASFVPTPGDFGRLDERFRLPAEFWLELTTYRDYGFAVFKLRPGSLHRAHPMAFEFPTRHPERLFFPTIHMHDRHVKRTAEFDHALYCQPSHEMQFHMEGWEDTPGSASVYIRCEQARPLFDLELPCWRYKLEGEFENADSWVGEGGRLPEPSRAIVV